MARGDQPHRPTSAVAMCRRLSFGDEAQAGPRPLGLLLVDPLGKEDRHDIAD